MEISAGFNSSADLQYWSWGVDGDCDQEESRPLKQLRASPFGNTNCTLLNSSIDRNLAERNRREKLTRRFAALSTLLPALKKRNKASILEEAISYILQLQKKVETLEKKITIKSCDDVASCSNQSLLSVDTESLALPLIKAKTCNCEVLFSIDCERRKGVLENIVGIIDNLHLSIVSCSVVHFGDSELNITIIAEMGKEYCMSIKEVVNNLHVALKI
ncbi:transcription factor bHLH19-like isoform X2 [Salvia miltiorrhiza]|uniref:transcription factor bHLH19-like isoform X2 n=1 Tax=Salvia miltiorrhiza TaxID=226208 RepID=UPI0025AC026C|nr:transcription factor bHLH19-like isoform X2 [Salvia miltiorrhiza]